MPFHEIREISFSDRFNSVWDRRRHPEQARKTGRKLVRRRVESRLVDPDREIDIWA